MAARYMLDKPRYDLDVQRNIGLKNVKSANVEAGQSDAPTKIISCDIQFTNWFVTPQLYFRTLLSARVGHEHKIKENNCLTAAYGNTFCKTIRQWNSLPATVVTVSSDEAFHSALKKQ